MPLKTTENSHVDRLQNRRLSHPALYRQANRPVPVPYPSI